MHIFDKRTNRIASVLHDVACSQIPVANAKLAACIVYKNDIVAVGVNQKKSHPFQAQYARHAESIYLHAETDAIKNALKVITVDDLSKSKLFVVRVTKDDKFAMAKPCVGCMRAIVNFGIRSVFYSTSNDSRAIEQL